MRWQILISIILIFLLLFVVYNLNFEKIRTAPPVDCFFYDVGSNPGGLTSIGLYVSKISNAHLSLIDNGYSKEIFCPGDIELGDTGIDFLGVTCEGDTNCHAYQSGGVQRLEFSSGIISCEFRSACEGDEFCILKMSNTEDAHVAECLNTDYINLVCCELGNYTSGCGDGIIDSVEMGSANQEKI